MNKNELYGLLWAVEQLLQTARFEDVIGIPWGGVPPGEIRISEEARDALLGRVQDYMQSLVAGPETSGDG
jgi:hypothetical protein